MRVGTRQSLAAITAAACAVLASGVAAVPAQASVPASRTMPTAHSSVVVRGLAFPEGRAMRLGLVGCDNIYQRVAESPQAMIGTGPGSAPAGRRSLSYDLVGGNALGPLSYVSSVAQTTSAGLTAYAAQGTTGVVWAGYQEPADRHTGRVWFGRASVAVPPGQWTRIEATDLTYRWSKWDMYAQAPVAGAGSVPDGTLADMVVRHRGDGAGFVMTGLGCDGNKFAMDALRLSTAGTATTYDLEGLATTATMQAPILGRVAAGEPVELRGTLTDNTGATLTGVTMRLESRVEGTSDWVVDQVVTVGAGGAVAQVQPEKTTSYRWRFADRPMAEGSLSLPFTVEVDPDASPSAGPSDEPGDGASSSPSDSAGPTKGAGPTRSAGPTKSPAPSATTGPSTSPSAAHSSTPSASPTRTPSPSTTQSPTQSPTKSPAASAGADPTPSGSASATAAGASASGTATHPPATTEP